MDTERYNYMDALRAARLIARDAGVKPREMAPGVHMPKRSFANKFSSGGSRDKQATLDPDSAAYEIPPGSNERFSKDQMKELASLLGYDSVKAMIYDAQQRLALPEGVSWARRLTEADLEQPVLQMRTEMRVGGLTRAENLPKYRLAFLALVAAETNKVSGYFVARMEGIRRPRSVERWLDDAPSGMDDATKIDVINKLAEQLGKELKIKDLSPEAMLQLAYERCPDQMPATERPRGRKGGEVRA